MEFRIKGKRYLVKVLVKNVCGSVFRDSRDGTGRLALPSTQSGRRGRKARRHQATKNLTTHGEKQVNATQLRLPRSAMDGGTTHVHTCESKNAASRFRPSPCDHHTATGTHGNGLQPACCPWPSAPGPFTNTKKRTTARAPHSRRVTATYVAKECHNTNRKGAGSTIGRRRPTFRKPMVLRAAPHHAAPHRTHAHLSNTTRGCGAVASSCVLQARSGDAREGSDFF